MNRLLCVLLVLAAFVTIYEAKKLSWQEEFVEKVKNNKTLSAAFVQEARSKPKVYDGNAFTCDILPPSDDVPTSVHRLRPSDIKVIGVLGDSLSAGTGILARTILGDLTSWRGLAFTGGGDETVETVVTLPNIFKKYNPNLYGYGLGTSKVSNAAMSRFSVANPGDTSADIVGQAELIVQRMKISDKIDFNNDWKVITIFIGGNDLCRVCRNKNYLPENYISKVKDAIDYIHANVPRVFINLLEPVNVTMLYNFKFTGLMCGIAHIVACNCAANPWTKAAAQRMVERVEGYVHEVNALVDSGRYEKDDFTVVVQPFFRYTLPPHTNNEVDMSYFAPDCFHFSLKGQTDAALALWNNMVEPVGKKRLNWYEGEKLECPTKSRPYLYTKKNSVASFYENDDFSAKNLAENRLLAKSAGSNDQKKAVTSSGGGVLLMVALASVAVLALVILGSVLYKRHQNKVNCSSRQRLLLNPDRSGDVRYNGNFQH